MNRNEHMDTARRILAGLAKLDPNTDQLALIDGTMVAGYHLCSAALHAHGVTESSMHFNTPSKFEVRPEMLPETVKPIYAVFKELEETRSYYVRSPNRPDAESAVRAKQLLEQMASLCSSA